MGCAGRAILQMRGTGRERNARHPTMPPMAALTRWPTPVWLQMATKPNHCRSSIHCRLRIASRIPSGAYGFVCAMCLYANTRVLNYKRPHNHQVSQFAPIASFDLFQQFFPFNNFTPAHVCPFDGSIDAICSM